MHTLAIDTSAITAALADLSTSGVAIVGAAVGVSVALFGLHFLWRKARSSVN